MSINTEGYYKDNHLHVGGGGVRGADSGRTSFVAACVVFRAILDISYVKYISLNYEYAGFGLKFTLAAYMLSWIFYAISLLIVPSRLIKLSDYFFVIATLSLIAPLTSLYGLTDEPAFPIFLSMGALYFVNFIVSSKIKTPRVPLIKGGEAIAFYVSVMMILISAMWFFISGSVRNFNLDITKVYQYRELNAELNNVGVLAYINNWVYKVFTIFLLAYCLHRRRYMMVAFCLGAQLFFFGVSAQKSVLLMPFLVFGVWYYFRRRNNLIVIPITMTAVVALALCLVLYSGDDLYASLLIRRVFYVPAYLTYKYFEFFGNHAHLYWSDSILSWLVKYDYNVTLAKVIGDYIGTGDNANSGFISSGYAQAGVAGVLIYTVIVGYTLKFLDAVAQSCDALWLPIALTVVPLQGLVIASDLPVIMVTHGFIVAILLLLLTRRRSASPTEN